MTPGKPTVHRLFGGGTLLAALGALVIASATPASATPLAWGNAQAWVADGDLAAGYSTAVSFGGDSEDHATADDVFGPLSEYAEISGESRTFIDDEGAHAEAQVDSAALQVTVGDLVELGMIDLPPETEPSDGGTLSDEEAELSPAEEREDQEPSPESSEAPEGNEGNGNENEEVQETPYEDPESSESPEATETTETPEATETPEEAEVPEDEPSPTVSDARVLPLSPSDEETPGDRVPRESWAEEPAIEFTVADVSTSASAGYGGQTEATFEHGDITAFGEPVGPLDDGANGRESVVEIHDKDGELVEEVPVSVHFVVNESTFEDEDEDWEGEGIRSWLTVWIQTGEAEDESGFAVDLADSWAVGSLYNEGTPPAESERGGEKVEENVSGGNLATTGSSLVALVTAAVVAVGGGTAATFLARKRTTAMDDQIED